MIKVRGRKKRSFLMAAIFTAVFIFTGLVSNTPIAAAKELPVTTLVETGYRIIPAGGPQKVIVKIALKASPIKEEQDRSAVNLAIVLDRSGSMTGQKIAKARDAAIEAFTRLSPTDIFSVVVYDHNVNTIIPAQRAVETDWLKNQIRRIRPGGSTALFGGVSQGASEVRKNLSGRYVHRVILLSDGLANVGPSSPADLGRLGAALIKEGISVTTIGVGLDYNEDLMTRLSQNSDGNSYFVESSFDLPRIFASELGDVLNVAAKTVKITIDCLGDVRPVGIIGRQGRIRGQRVELYMNQLYGGQEKFVLLEVEVPGGRDKEKISILKANVTYANPFTQKMESSSGMVSATYSSNREIVRKSVNAKVQRDYQLNLNAMAMDQAIQEADQGQASKAAQTLRGAAQRVKRYAVELNDEVLMEKAEELEEESKKLEKAKALAPRGRKALRTKSFQLKRQQKSE